jgi:integrase
VNYTKRGDSYHFDGMVGGRRVRCALGTRDPKTAKRLADRVGYALVDGPKSEVWTSLKLVLPPASYKTLTHGIGLTAQPSFAELEARYRTKLDNRVRLSEITESTADLYGKSVEGFFSWLLEQPVRLMDDLTPGLLEAYFVKRKSRILDRPQSSNARSLNTDHSALSGLFKMAVEEGLIKQSPVRSKPQCDGSPRGAEPFTPEEMKRLEANATGEYELPFMLLKWTGLRGSDAAGLLWDEIDLEAGLLTRTTQKRGTVVTIPIAKPLEWILTKVDFEVWGDGAHDPLDRVLAGMTREKLYRLMLDLGKKAGVENSNPHRFRDSLACFILRNGGTIYDVAKILGDQVSTVEKFYSPFTSELQERVRKVFEQEEK